VNDSIRLVERDFKIFQEVNRWRVVTGKHLCALVDFSNQRACDRRLRKLIESGYLIRKKEIYGIAGIYFLTHKAKVISGIPVKYEKVRISQIKHDISVADTAIYFHNKYNIPYEGIITEKQLHAKDGFSTRKHRPDFTVAINGLTYCVEVELSLKNIVKFEKNIQDNFSNYDVQIWIVPDFENKITKILKENQDKFPNIRIINFQEVQKKNEHS
jgi:hypothetical protein